jgi:hypothetical protein
MKNSPEAPVADPAPDHPRLAEGSRKSTAMLSQHGPYAELNMYGR